MKKMVFLLCVLLLTGLLAACGGTASTPAAPPTKTTTVSTPTPKTEVITSPIVGTYTTTITQADVASMPDLKSNVGDWTITLRNDGTYTATLKGGPSLNAQYNVTQDQVMFSNAAVCVQYFGPDAATGTYAWTLNGKQLIMKAIQDKCSFRKLVHTAHPWIKQS